MNNRMRGVVPGREVLLKERYAELRDSGSAYLSLIASCTQNWATSAQFCQTGTRRHKVISTVLSLIALSIILSTFFE